MRRQRAKLCIGLVIGGALALAGCSSAASSSAPTTLARGEGALAQGLGQKAARSSAKGAPTAGAPAASATVGETAVTLAPLIVRTGDVTLGVRRPNVVKTFDRVASIALALGGFVQSSTTGVSPTVTPPQPQPVESSTASSSAMATGASLVVRVPTNQFAALGKQVAALGHVRSETLTGKDVTGQSINLQARITNLESEQDALRALMARTGSIPDILQVQNELFSVEGQIEQLTGDESSLLDKATYATLSVEIQPFLSHSKPVSKARPDAVTRAFNLAGHNLVVGLRGLALAIGWAFPILLLASLAGAVLWLRRRLVRRRAPTTTPTPAN
ncbi:MAG: DUF4349 domain-containing protein [Acidimicrobiales bacterium]|jgi:hypothetical protein